MFIYLRICVFIGALYAVTCSMDNTFNLETGIRMMYNNYKQCQHQQPDTLSCLKFKAVKLIDRALSINNIPITKGVSLMKRVENQRSLDDEGSGYIDEKSLSENSNERNEQLDGLLWDRVRRFIETRSLQLKVNQLLFPDKDGEDGRGKKDKNKGMYMYMLMMKGGMLALAYKGLALLAGKALLVSKLALTLALLVAVKKLFSHGHSQKTTYEIVKTPIITHSHQYSGNTAASTHGHYGTAPEFSSYEGGPYARSIDLIETSSKDSLARPMEPTYVTRIIETVHGRSLSDTEHENFYEKSENDNKERKIKLNPRIQLRALNSKKDDGKVLNTS